MRPVMLCMLVLILAALAPGLDLQAAQKGTPAAAEPAPESKALLDAVCGRTDVYGCYTNHKYGYVIAWPKKLLTPRGESDDGGGQVFAATSGRAELAVWAVFNNVLEQTIPEAFQEAQKEEGAQVTYKRLGKDFFVLTGFKGQKIFYRKTLLRHDVLASFEVVYEPSLKEVFDPIVKDMARSFTVDPAFAWQFN